LAGVAAMAAWIVDRERLRGAWAAFFLSPAIYVYDCNMGGASDHDLAFFAAPLFLAAVRAAPRFGARSCALAGAFAAGAILSKLQAVYLLAGVGLVLRLLWLGAAAENVRARRAGRAGGAGGPPPRRGRGQRRAALARG